MKDLFTMARANKPAIIFIDEVDVLCTSQQWEYDNLHKMKVEFMDQMDGNCY